MENLIVPGTLDSLEVIRRYVAVVAGAAGLDKKATYRLQLAVDEIATNIITHGYAEAGYEGLLAFRAEIDETALTIVVEDTAPSYDPGRQISADARTSVEPSQVGGLGLFLTSTNVDEFRYERIENRNRHTFTIYLTRVRANL